MPLATAVPELRVYRQRDTARSDLAQPEVLALVPARARNPDHPFARTSTSIIDGVAGKPVLGGWVF